MADAKICGVTDLAAAEAAVAGGARYLGFVFHAKSPRNIRLEKAAAIAERVSDRIEIVALTVNAQESQLAEIEAVLRPDWLQLHGNETPRRVAEARHYARNGVIRAVSIARAEDVAAAAAYAEAADMLLFDAKAPPTAENPGGNGLAFDWKILRGQRIAAPWFLAGGLNPENVSEAIEASGAALVDVSSGVESAPGVKDAERIARFLKAAGASPDTAR